MADERAGKLRRLERFRRAAPHLSQNALSAVLKEARDVGLPELTNRNAIREARNSTCNTQTEFGPLHQELDLTPASGTRPIKLSFIHPLAFLAVLCGTCQCFSVYMESAVAAVPSSYEHPWDVIFYSDEVLGYGHCRLTCHCHGNGIRRTATDTWPTRKYGAVVAALPCHACGHVSIAFSLPWP